MTPTPPKKPSPSQFVPGDEGEVRCEFKLDGALSAWQVIEAHITDEINAPYHAVVHLRTDDADAEPAELLGQSCTLLFSRATLHNEYHGIVHTIENGSFGGGHKNISIEMSSALGLLARGRTTRIFQGKTVPAILDEVLTEALGHYDRGIENYMHNRKYGKCEYRVQYDESDLDFCNRLIEEEGIVYWFDRSATPESMVLSDDPFANQPVASVDGAKIEFIKYKGGIGGAECVHDLQQTASMQPNKLTMHHYDWTQPNLSITQPENEKSAPGIVNKSYKIYDHDRKPPTFHQYDADTRAYGAQDSKKQHDIRWQALSRDGEVQTGSASVIGFAAGRSFELVGHANLNDEYVLTQVMHVFESDGGSGSGSYTNRFCCIPSITPYRPVPKTTKPRVMGIETAKVVGDDGHEILTDEHGRVKVQFHWDQREALYKEKNNGKDAPLNERATCYLRVSQPWAGPGFGVVFLPRVGMEVTVSFIHGDPDQPMITGTVYNGANAMPYPQPKHKTKSTIRTQTSLDGDGYNELSFEDEKNKEEVYLRAQRNLREEVLNDHMSTVDNYRSEKVGAGAEQFITGGASRTVDGGLKEVIKAGSNELQDNCTSIAVDRSIEGDVTQATVGNVKDTIDGNETREVSGDVARRIKGNLTESSMGNATRVCAGDFDLLTPNGSGMISAGTKITITAPVIEEMSYASAYQTHIFKGENIGLKQSNVATNISTYVTNTSLGVAKTDLWAAKLDYAKIRIQNQELDLTKVKNDIKSILVAAYIYRMVIIS